MKALIPGLLLTLLPSHALAVQLWLIWEFDRTFTPQPTSFTITYTSSTDATGLATMTVPPSARGACEAAGAVTEDAYCAVWPTCPEAGTVMQFWLHAVWPTGTSAESNLALCAFTAAQPCVCLDPGQEHTLQTHMPAEPPITATGASSALPPETDPRHWTDALAAILSTTPTGAT